MLAELSRMSAKVAEHLHLNSLEKLEEERLKLRSVAVPAHTAESAVMSLTESVHRCK